MPVGPWLGRTIHITFKSLRWPVCVLQRPITTEDGLEVGMEEYFDYIFPDEAAAAPNLKLLEAAQRWKRQKVMENGA